MFRTFKIYRDREISQDEILSYFKDFGYRRVPAVKEERDFSVKGEIVSIWPFSFENPVRILWDFDKIKSIESFDAESGLCISGYEVIVILPFLGRKSKTVYSHQVPISGFVDINEGDFVVHVHQGIGIYRGRKKVKGKDYFVVEYADKDKLYVPVQDLHLIQKYISFWHKKPPLYKLGSKKWRALKKKAQAGIHNLALELIRTEAMRKTLGGQVFGGDPSWQERFNSYFPYQETPDQEKAWETIKEEMEQGLCMDRLICGDVGYGKTEVALRAAFKAAMNSKQTAFLVPTTILAEQHYYNFMQRIKDFPIQVQMLSRFKTGKEQDLIVEDLKKGKIDVIVGTHRLLASDVRFHDLGLLIIDEEQRFGVGAKEKIKKLKTQIDVLVLTATPIPRTLYMALSGIRDISVINTPPRDRMAVHTAVCEFDRDLIRQAIIKEKKRGGQVFFIHNRIKDIEKMFKMLRNILPSDFKISLAYGKMSSRFLEKIMLDFLKGNVDVLLSTNIVESGIDVPRANTIIINNAHMFGMADLHQLRGRVGRTNIQSYTYYLVPSFKGVSEEAKRRLKVLREYSFLGAGFKISMQDLELRGAGNILGPQQHGFVYHIGFDLYCRILKEEIECLKKEYASVQR